ncbi:hypothetical protein HII12_003058 [Brettanomyces bruxellensis]|uniref:TauD/TfdA-like domain-containing protein n=1 Tax=Dekkera bruxellensis TaxID=5007 RepID=A0A8H6BCY3_DEKBR|nr:hypothetical protein HII12_003058 [Brettanomyces bruxellensis]
MAELDKIKLKDSHLVNGYEFPVAYKVKSEGEQSISTEDVAQLLKNKAEEGFFRNILDKNGAIVLRLGNIDPNVISKYVEAIGYGSKLVPFVQNGSTAERTQITNVLTTANEGPGGIEIYQHNEFSRFKTYPSTLFFACTEYTAKGGETPIVHGAETFEDVKQLDGRIIILLEEQFSLKIHWSKERRKAGKVCFDHISEDFEWDKDNNLDVKEHTEPVKLYNNGDKKYGVLFNSIPTFYGDIRDKKNSYGKTTEISYDDNEEPISHEDLDLILQSSLDTEYNHNWVPGDLAIINNYQVSHGRKAMERW